MDGPMAAVLGIMFLSALIRGLTGFGNALVAMPLLALVIPVRTATPVVALAATFMATIMLWKSWREVDVRSASTLLAAAVLGTPLGLFFLKGAHEALVQVVLALVIALFSAYSLIRPRHREISGWGWAVVAGFSAGVLGGAYNTNGPPVVIYGDLRGWPPDRFRATLQGFFLPIGLVIIAGHYLAGLWTRDTFRYTVAALPCLLAGLAASSYLAPRIPGRQFRAIVHGFLLLCSAVLLVKAFTR